MYFCFYNQEVAEVLEMTSVWTEQKVTWHSSWDGS